MKGRGEGDSVLIRPKGNADHPGRGCHVKGKVTAHSEGLANEVKVNYIFRGETAMER